MLMIMINGDGPDQAPVHSVGHVAGRVYVFRRASHVSHPQI
jgi:hypothetical protein